MAEGPEIETGELREQIHELHHHHEASGDAAGAAWTKSIALTTAILAVFAAIGALQAGALVNEAMVQQLRASDTWSEYQANKSKAHSYQISLNEMLDRGVSPSAKAPKVAEDAPLPPADRAAQYLAQVHKELDKTTELQSEAKKLEKESAELMHKHHTFAYQVALLQVAIALGAVSALTRVKWVWAASLAVGLVGIVMFFIGWFR